MDRPGLVFLAFHFLPWVSLVSFGMGFFWISHITLHLFFIYFSLGEDLLVFLGVIPLTSSVSNCSSLLSLLSC